MLVFPPAPAGPLLHLGGGSADEAPRLACGAPVIAAMHDPALARVLARQLRQAGASSVEVVVCDDASCLPFPDGTLSRIVLEQDAMPAYGLASATVDRFAAEMARVAVTGGVVMLGLANRWMRSGVLARLRRGLAGAPSHERLEAPSARGGAHAAPPPWSALCRAMAGHGFSAPQTWAPLPDARRVEMIVPLERGPILRYCLDNLIRKNSPLVRAALAGAGSLSRVGLSRLAVPYVFLYFRRGAPGG
jgi:hypothetical protein